MKLSELLTEVEVIETKGNIDVDIYALSHNNCSAEYMLHFCYKGVNVDGHNYYYDAISRGAVAFVVEKFVDTDLPQILVKNTRKAMAIICANFFGNPSCSMKMIGITGTNGKTTCSYIISKILKESGFKVGVIGTNGYTIFGLRYPLNMTTPDPYELQEILSKMLVAGVEYVVMEVSAHATALCKTSGIKFLIGAFTNLIQDHLDFFGTMQRYGEAKKEFLLNCTKTVINIDDEYAKYWIKELPCPTTYGKCKSDIRIVGYKTSIKGSKFILQTEKKNNTGLILWENLIYLIWLVQ